ncbi:sensor histidine kinase [Lysinibacillus piscis]|uniref:histidine kinase n=1 Tax=Lysinibacillus piscis TaxID=2518931 RepID=A0ABQ5NFJ9_9BACI|nr:sensor histidine kinase [Lysinibacillus sp. KH24]GLC87165.1 hypothetical protein LYSBPC_02920 [Lysinibacillus sp. KH24]
MLTEMVDLRQFSNLSHGQREIILGVARNLQLIADLSQADVFINCLLEDGDAALVVAEAKPTTVPSLYQKSMVGHITVEEMEPGVFFCLQTGKPVASSRGITAERGVMRQDIVPIKDEQGTTIAALIKESNISEVVENKKTMAKLLTIHDNEEKQRVLQAMAIQEIHHRVKNNLQVIASLLRLQMRRFSSAEVMAIFHDSIARISSMALVHDYLAQARTDEADIKWLITEVTTLLVSSSIIPGQDITVSVEGESVYCPSNQATVIVMIVNELVQNSIKHAFPTKRDGAITIQIKTIKQMMTITVIDNGCGIDDSFSLNHSASLGLQLVEMLVGEKLQGVFSFQPSIEGTRAFLTFPANQLK